MSTYIAPQPTLSEAWAETVEVVCAAGGRLVNVLTTVTNPGEEAAAIRALVDDLLSPGTRGKTTIQSVETVANTIFPASLYNQVGFDWDMKLGPGACGQLDQAANDLYEAYGTMLPLLTTVHANRNGTYFGRMISWPGKMGGGRNQLEDQIRRLRAANRGGQGRYNLADIAVGGEGDDRLADPNDLGLQTYSPTDNRIRGFPCLVHVDLTLLDGKLSMLGVYRHQYLVTKAYGNILGLSRLLRFLAQQTGYEVGELAIQATLADDERDAFGGKKGIAKLVSQTRSLRTRTGTA